MSPKIIFFRSVRPENLHVDSPGVVLQGRLGISPTVITFGRQRTTFLIRARLKIKKVVKRSYGAGCGSHTILQALEAGDPKMLSDVVELAAGFLAYVEA